VYILDERAQVEAQEVFKRLSKLQATVNAMCQELEANSSDVALIEELLRRR
jgi:hypothetical protein